MIGTDAALDVPAIEVVDRGKFRVTSRQTLPRQTFGAETNNMLQNIDFFRKNPTERSFRIQMKAHFLDEYGKFSLCSINSAERTLRSSLRSRR